METTNTGAEGRLGFTLPGFSAAARPGALAAGSMAASAMDTEQRTRAGFSSMQRDTTADSPDGVPESAPSTAARLGSLGRISSEEFRARRAAHFAAYPPTPQAEVEPARPVDAFYVLDSDGIPEGALCAACASPRLADGGFLAPMFAAGVWNLRAGSNDGEVCEGCGAVLLLPACSGCDRREDDCICDELRAESDTLRPVRHNGEWLS